MTEETFFLFKKMIDIRDLLESYRSECISKAVYYEDECTNCMTGNCTNCAAPEWEEAQRCLEIIDAIDDYFATTENDDR